MPTIIKIGKYRFFFYSNEGNEPPHIHVEYENKTAKFWLKPVELAFSEGCRGHELTKIRSLIIANRDLFLEKWHEFFGR